MAHPAVEVRAMPPVLYAVSDIHGGYDRLVTLLAKNGVIAQVPDTPGHAQWSAGAAMLVVVGDMIDKGPQGIEVLDLMRTLQSAAPQTGGRVIALLGNHEAEFLAYPLNDLATKDSGIDVELKARSIDPTAYAQGADPTGKWLRDQPLAAKIGRWFFAHGGSTQGRSIAALESSFEQALNSEGFPSSTILGPDSILEARAWYDDPTVTANLTALDADHVVIGHDPNALGPRGAIASGLGGRVMRIDCGLSPLVNDSTGKLLVVRHDALGDHPEEHDSAGSVRPL